MLSMSKILLACILLLLLCLLSVGRMMNFAALSATEGLPMEASLAPHNATKAVEEAAPIAVSRAEEVAATMDVDESASSAAEVDTPATATATSTTISTTATSTPTPSSSAMQGVDYYAPPALVERYRGKFVCVNSPHYPHCDIYLCGTLHVAQSSVEMVREAIRSLQPNYVVLELCEARVDSLEDGEEGPEVTLSQVTSTDTNVTSDTDANTVTTSNSTADC
jgi:hypothetical protein